MVCGSQMSTGTGLMILDIGTSPYQQVLCGDTDLLVHPTLSCWDEVKTGRPLAPQVGEPQVIQIRWHHNLIVQHWNKCLLPVDTLKPGEDSECHRKGVTSILDHQEILWIIRYAQRVLEMIHQRAVYISWLYLSLAAGQPDRCLACNLIASRTDGQNFWGILPQ